jgi:hypothetical protein
VAGNLASMVSSDCMPSCISMMWDVAVITILVSLTWL